MQLTRRFFVCFEDGKKEALAEYRTEGIKPCYFGPDGATVKFGNGVFRFADGRVARESTHN